MDDRLPPKGMCSGSRDFFEFWETVQDRHGCTGSIIGNRMWPIEWYHCQCPWRSLLLFEIFL